MEIWKSLRQSHGNERGNKLDWVIENIMSNFEIVFRFAKQTTSQRQIIGDIF